MELKFKEVSNEYFNIDDSNKDYKELKVKSYLTLSELKSIVDSALEEHDMVIREMIIISMTTDYCTNLDITSEDNKINCEDVYDLCAKYNLIDMYNVEINNYYMIDKLIKESESAYKIVKMITEQIGKYVKDFDMSKIQDGITQLQDNLKK